MARSEQFIAYRFGSFVLNLEQGVLLTVDGREIPLRPKSFALLRLLVENAGRLLSQEAIMDALWPSVFVTQNSVSQCISDIRNALGSEACQLLRTVPCRGYLFRSDVIAVPRANSVVTLSHRRREARMSHPISSYRGGVVALPSEKCAWSSPDELSSRRDGVEPRAHGRVRSTRWD